MPSIACTLVAVAGKVWSGVAVASTIRSMSCAAHARRGQRRARRVGGERRGRLVRAGDVAEADAGALDDPFVAGVDRLRQFGVRHAARGQRRAGADDDRTRIMPCRLRLASKLPRSSAMRRVRSSRTIFAATPIAVRDAGLVGAAVALHDDAVEPEEDRAVVIVGIEMMRAAVRSPGARSGSRSSSAPSCGTRACSRSATKRAVPSTVFSAILPEKPSHTITSTSPRDSLSPSMKPLKVSGRCVAARSAAAASRMLVGALHVLGADVEQRDARASRGRAWCAHRPRP